MNIEAICSALAPILTNPYHLHSTFYINAHSIPSQEEALKGTDPLAMAMYGIGTLPLIDHLRKNTSVHQVWYTDNSAAGGSLQNLHLWWDQLNMLGPHYGYFPNNRKTDLLV